MESEARGLERRAGGGDVQARARLLVERVRAGRITEENLQLAMKFGDEASSLALNQPLETFPADKQQLLTWLTELEQQDTETFFRAILSLARGAYELTDKKEEDIDVIKLTELAEQELVRRFGSDTDVDTGRPGSDLDLRVQVANSSDRLRAEADAVNRTGGGRDRFYSLKRRQVTALLVRNIAATVFDSDPSLFLRETDADFTLLAYRSLSDIDAGNYVAASGAMKQAMQQEVLPWVLKERDPLRERAEARKRAALSKESEAQRKQAVDRAADELRRRLDEHTE